MASYYNKTESDNKYQLIATSNTYLTSAALDNYYNKVVVIKHWRSMIITK